MTIPAATSPTPTTPGPAVLRAPIPKDACRVEFSLPPRECSPNNAGSHWAVRHRARRAYVEDCIVRLRRAKAPPFTGPVRLHLAFYLCRPPGALGKFRVQGLYFPKDRDNAVASAKGAQDALVEAGIVPGDSAAHIHLAPVELYTRAKEHQGRTCLVLTIEPMEASK